MSILKFEFTFNTTTGEFSVANTETGEVKSVTTKVTKKRVKKEESSIPELVLEENKYILNTAAITLLGVEAGDKLDIQYQNIDSKIVPVIGKEEVFGGTGNKLTKSNTVTYKGAKHEELIKYGTEFTITTHPSRDDVFVLKGNKEQSEPIEEIKGLDLDEIGDLSDLIDDADVTEISANFFNI